MYFSIHASGKTYTGAVMVALRIDALTSVALSMLKPIQPPPTATDQASSALKSTQALTQGLAQTLFQQTLQSAATPAADLATLINPSNLDSTAALLASMSNPQSATATTAATSTTSAPTSVPELQATPTVDEGLTLEAATLNATRFGAGVGAPGTAAPLESSSSNQQVRDASTVVRLGALQAEGSHPGPEAYPQPKTSLAETLHAYQAVAAEAQKVDLTV
jgi:hypothetical protein